MGTRPSLKGAGRTRCAGETSGRKRTPRARMLRDAVGGVRLMPLENLEKREYLAGEETGLVSGSIAVPGEVDRYSFKLTADAKMYFDARVGVGSMNWSLDGPTGRVVAARDFTASDSSGIGNPVLVLKAGDYTLSVDADNDVTGNYEFFLTDLANATLLTPGTVVSSTLTPASETDLYQ